MQWPNRDAHRDAADGGMTGGGMTDGGMTDGGMTDGGMTDGGMTERQNPWSQTLPGLGPGKDTGARQMDSDPEWTFSNRLPSLPGLLCEVHSSAVLYGLRKPRDWQRLVGGIICEDLCI
jgi:hypothetical protein